MNFQVVRQNPGLTSPRVALFDFDGTVSLLRSGWQQIMIDLMVQVLPRIDGEEESDVAAMASEFVHRTNGQPTLFQMQGLAEMMRARGEQGQDAEGYKQLFLDRLARQVGPRLAAIESKAVGPERWQVPAVEQMLQAVAARDIPCYLASGTDQTAVRAETIALGLDKYFAGVYGATSDTDNSTKAAIFERLVSQYNLSANELVTFGDGVEEIRLTKAAGGTGIGVARDETNSGEIEPVQCARLVAAGADVIIGDFRVCGHVIEYLFESQA